LRRCLKVLESEWVVWEEWRGRKSMEAERGRSEGGMVLKSRDRVRIDRRPEFGAGHALARVTPTPLLKASGKDNFTRVEGTLEVS
jgi:hypothetical protein